MRLRAERGIEEFLDRGSSELCEVRASSSGWRHNLMRAVRGWQQGDTT